jgi:hypothetical protein
MYILAWTNMWLYFVQNIMSYDQIVQQITVKKKMESYKRKRINLAEKWSPTIDYR